MKQDISLTKEQEVIFEDIFYKNKEKINKIFAIVLMVASILGIGAGMLEVFIKNYFGAEWCKNVFYISYSCSLVFAIVLYLVKLNANIKAVLLNIVLILCASILYFLYSATMSLFVLPILISIMYFDKKMVIINGIAEVVLLAIILVLSVWLDQNVQEIHSLHVYENAFVYQEGLDTFVFIFIPKCIIIALSMLVGVFASVNGRKIVLEQAITSSKISVMKNDINTASKIQNRVLPNGSFTSKNGEFNLYSVLKSAKDTAGDFYDYFYIDKNNLVVLVADVSDKGLPASMFMMLAKNTIKLCVQNIKDLKLALERANEILKADANEMFTTLWVGSIDTLTGKVLYVNAGHVYPFIKHKDGQITEIVNEPNLFLGMFDNVKYDVNSFTLDIEDILVLYTDGATDAVNENNTSFGKAELIKNLKGSTANEVCQNLLNAIHNFVGNANQFDDITIMGVQRLNVKSTNELKVLANEEGIEKVVNTINEYIANESTEKARKDIDIIIDEVCANICEYSSVKEYVVNYEKQGNELIIKFIDSGKPFNPLAQDSNEVDPLSLGGKGIMLVKSFASSMEYSRECDKNILTIKKNLLEEYE